MTSYLAKLYQPAGTDTGADGARAAAALTRQRTGVRYLRSISSSADESCFDLFEAAWAGETSGAPAPATVAEGSRNRCGRS